MLLHSTSILLVVTMYLPFRLLATELLRNDCEKEFYHFLRLTTKVQASSLRVKFLSNCKQADVIPRFLRFRIPTNGCFDNESVRSFQRKLLHKELVRAREEETVKIDQLEDCINDIHTKAPLKTLPSIDFYARSFREKTYRRLVGIVTKESSKS